MKKVLVVAAVAALMMAPVSMAQERAAGTVYPGEAGFVLPGACLPAAIEANGAAPCLALFPGLTATEAQALIQAVTDAGGGASLQLLIAALQEAGLAAGSEVSPL